MLRFGTLGKVMTLTKKEKARYGFLCREIDRLIREGGDQMEPLLAELTALCQKLERPDERAV
jgi:hypothetical protein